MASEMNTYHVQRISDLCDTFIELEYTYSELTDLGSITGLQVLFNRINNLMRDIDRYINAIDANKSIAMAVEIGVQQLREQVLACLDRLIAQRRQQEASDGAE